MKTPHHNVEGVELPECGMCGSPKDCANCIDAYGENIDCGWPICRECRDLGHPEGSTPPEWAREQQAEVLVNPTRLIRDRLENLAHVFDFDFSKPRRPIRFFNPPAELNKGERNDSQ